MFRLLIAIGWLFVLGGAPWLILSYGIATFDKLVAPEAARRGDRQVILTLAGHVLQLAHDNGRRP